jgi:serine/threonine-protein kinase
MAEIWRATDVESGEAVAVKRLVLDPEDPFAEEDRTRLLHEIQALQGLEHPNIVRCLGWGTDAADRPYLVQQWLEGEDLARRQARHALSLDEVREVMILALDGLEAAHRRGVVHRDIKPGNIMLLEDGRVKVTDFGIAQVIDSTQTRTGVILGTPSYMSPEQLAGKDVDGRSDLFSLGIVFYELLTGSKPFKGENISATLYAITHTAHPSVSEIVPDIPACCTAIVDKLLAKGVSKRFRSAAQAHKAIERCRTELQ